MNCDFNDGMKCLKNANNIAIDPHTERVIALVCENHANELSDDPTCWPCATDEIVWFKEIPNGQP